MTTILRLAIFLPLLSSCASTAISRCDEQCQSNERRLTYVETHPELTPPIAQAVMSGKLIIGMSKDDVIASIGPPQDIMGESTTWVAREQWIYQSSTVRNYYFFKFGKLNAWQ